MRSFREYTDGDTIVIHGGSISLPEDIAYLQSAPEPGVPSTLSIRIFADVVTVSGTVYNGGGDLKITCRVLKLLGSVTFDVSAPAQLSAAAPPFEIAEEGVAGQDGVQGVEGYPGGNIFILCGVAVYVYGFTEEVSPDDDVPSARGADFSEYICARPSIVDHDLDEHVAELVNSVYIMDKPLSNTDEDWISFLAAGGKAGDGQDGQDGGQGAAGSSSDESTGEDGARGATGGDGGAPGIGGTGGNIRFSTMLGTYLARNMSASEAEWSAGICHFLLHYPGGENGEYGAPGSGGVGGMGGTGEDSSGNNGPDGFDGDTYGGSVPEAQKGTDPGNGMEYSETEFVGMLDVDHLLRLERVAGKAWLNGTHTGEDLLIQVKFVKFFAKFLLGYTDDSSSIASQLVGLISTCELSLQRMKSGANYFGFMPGYAPRTTTETIMERINTLLPLAETVEEQLEAYDDTVSTNADMTAALDSAKEIATANLTDQRNSLVELDASLATQLSAINEQQREIVRQWQGDDEGGVQGLVNIRSDFLTALNSWEPPSDGPNWWNIGLIIGEAVICVVITVASGGTAGAAVAGAALASQAAKSEELLGVLETGVSAAVDVASEFEQATNEEAPLDTLSVPITQDMDDTLCTMLIEEIDAAAESTGGDIDSYATALKNAFRMWIDLCQERNASIVEYQETIVAQQLATAQVERTAALLTRINEQTAENIIDPNTPLLAEFMESCLDDQTFFLLRELFMEYAKLVNISALSADDDFTVTSDTTVAYLASMHARYLMVYSTYQDGLVQLSTEFQVTVDLPDDVVQELATERKAAFRFTSLPESLGMLEDIVVYTLALRVGQGALKTSGYVTAGFYCEQDSRSGLSCYDVAKNVDDFVAKLVGEGNTGAKLEGTDWTITLRYATNVTSVDFGMLQNSDEGLRLIITGIGNGPDVQSNILNAENIVLEDGS